MTNLGKKADRLQLLQYQFNKHTEKGCKHEIYNDLNIFTNTLISGNNTRYTLVIYSGTSTNPVCNYYYITEESRANKITQYKAYSDRKEQAKEANKGKRVLTGAALCAAAIREELKKLFPIYKFSVTCENFSMGNSVNISWTDGATSKQVEEITGKYQYGHFDGMSDMYENTNSRDDIPQAKYVNCNRKLSDELKAITKPHLQELLKDYTPSSYHNEIDTILYRILSRTEIKDINNVKGIEEFNDNNIVGMDGNYKVSFINPETPAEQKQQHQPNIKPVSTEAGEINIIEYSDKAIAVIGDTKPVKELLKSLGGSFNPRLTCGCGWIFSKKKLEEVQIALINYNKSAQIEPQPENTNLPVLYTAAASPVQTIQDAEIIEETPTGKALKLEYFKILWHEGHQNPSYNNAIFTDWQEVQKAFYKLWDVNEKGQDGGYSKVKCEIKFKGLEAVTDRIDITNSIDNGDFNPSHMHILEYLRQTILEDGEEIEQDWRKHPELDHRHPLNVCDPQSSQYKEALKEYEADRPKQYNNIADITAAAKGGKVISLFNLSQIINNNPINV